MLAPFEGLYRRSGYEALDAMRATFADADVDADGVGVIPLALDDLADPGRARRSAEKMMADPAVAAVVGPLSPDAGAAVHAVLAQAPIWIAPYAVDPAGGFADPATATGWADGLVAAIGAAAHAQGSDRLVLAGWTPGWPLHTAEEWAAIAGMTVLLSDTEAAAPALIDTAISPGDAVFWLGDAADGARYLAELRTALPQVPFWLGPQGGDPIFVERAAGALEQTYWAIWSPVGYNQTHDAPNFPASPAAQLVYLATRDALDRMAGQSSARMVPTGAPTWEVLFFSFAADNASIPLRFE